jgi:hypothetical protein
MRHIKQTDVDAVLKAPHQARWRKTLRAVLQNPGISDEQRAAVRRKLDDIASGKDYGARIPNAGGIPADAPPWGILRRRVVPSTKALSRKTKAELTALARSLGVSVDPAATKAALISTIEEREL